MYSYSISLILFRALKTINNWTDGDPRELVLGSAKLTRASAEQQAREKPH